MAASALTAEVAAALDSLDAVLRVERLLAVKRRDHEALVVRMAQKGGDAALSTYAAESRTRIDTAAARLDAERLTRWAP